MCISKYQLLVPETPGNLGYLWILRHPGRPNGVESGATGLGCGNLKPPFLETEEAFG